MGEIWASKWGDGHGAVGGACGLMWSMGHMYLLPILLILYALACESERDHEAALRGRGADD